MENIISKLEYGAVLAIGVIEKNIVLYFENMHICFYDIIKSELVADRVIDNNITILDYRIKIHEKKRVEEILIIRKGMIWTMKVEGNTFLEKDIRFRRKLENSLIIECKFDSYFTVYDAYGAVVMVGKHNNWVTDACINSGSLFTVSYDGCIKKWDISKAICIGYFAIKRGWITALANNEENLYIGTQYGELICINRNQVKINQVNQGAIWNIYRIFDGIYAVSEDGYISMYDTLYKIKKGIRCSDGWINAVTAYGNDLVAVSSRGEVIMLDKLLCEYEQILKISYWINNIVIVENVAYLVTAEGYIIKLELLTLEYRVLKISSYQLIDIVVVDDGVLLLADVEGHIWMLNMQMQIIDMIDLEGLHITSICFNNKRRYLYVSTLDEILVLINLNNTNKSCMVNIGKGRIWKADFLESNRKVAIITTEKRLIIFDENLEHILMKIASEEMLTTCKIVADSVISGNDKGSIDHYNISNNIEDVILQEECIHRRINKDFREEMKKEIVIFYDSKTSFSNLYQQRDKRILDMSGYRYREVNVAQDDEMRNAVIQCSGWAKFPQIIFYGHFISSASVLPQMFETGTLKRCVDSILEGE